MSASRVSSHQETTCAAPGCANPVTRRRRGRPAIYCSAACRSSSYRSQRRRVDEPIVVEIDHGSTNAKRRPAGRVWMVRLRRGQRSVIVAIGLGRPSADHLAHQISDLLGPGETARGGAID